MKNGNQKKRKGIIFSLSFIAVIGVVGGIGFLLPPQKNPETSETSETILAEENPVKETKNGVKDVCRKLPPGASVMPTSFDTNWELLGIVGIPSSPTAGAFQIEGDGFRSCFEPSALGALLATANAMVMNTDPVLQLKFWEKRVQDGAIKDAIMAKTSTQTQTPSMRAVQSVQIAGFRMNNFSLEYSLFDIAFRGDNNVLFSLSMASFYDTKVNDWITIPSPDGSFNSEFLGSLGGFTSWSGVR